MLNSSLRLAGRTLFWTGVVLGLIWQGSAQVLRLDPPEPVAGGMRLRLEGPPNTLHRIDVATALPFWSALDVMTQTTASKSLVDPEAQAGTRFYRAVQITPGMKILRVQPGVGASGDEVMVEGQFFVSGQPGENAVSFGGVDAVVVSATAARLTVRIPVDARSGPVVVRTATAAAAAPEAFTVLTRVPVRVEPPGGGEASAYTVVNTYSGAAGAELAIRKGEPLISMAVPVADARGTLLALSIDPPSVLVFSAASTAEALVFLHPWYQTRQVPLAVRAQAVIHETPEVGDLARLMGRHFGAGLNPVEQPDFAAAYSNAIHAVHRSGPMQALVRAVQTESVPTERGTRGSARPASTADVADFPVDRDWIEVTRFDAPANNTISEIFNRFQGKIEGDLLPVRQRLVRRGQSETYPYFTTVDWVVRWDEINVEAAFPLGRPDFNRAWQKPDSRDVYPLLPSPPGTPADEAFPRFATVGAKTFNDVTVPVKTLAGYLVGKAVDALKLTSDTITLPDRDAMYRVTAVGPSFELGPEADTAAQAFKDERFRALTLNLVGGMFDTCSVLMDLKALDVGPFVAEVSVKVSLEAQKKLPAIHQSSDLPPAILDLAKFFLQEFADEMKNRYLEHRLGEAMELGADVTAKNLLTAVAPTLKAADIGGGIGQIALRVRGTAVISPLETTFVTVGDPFQMQFLDITPPVGQSRDEVTVRFRGPASLPPFGSRNPRDSVEFLGPDFFLGEILGVTGPDREGIQTVKVRIPDGLPTSSDGLYTVTVGTAGRVGRGTFRMASGTAIRTVTPGEAFPASDDVQGFPFAGDTVRLTGVNFNRRDRFFVQTSTGEVLVTGVQDNAPDGDVSLRVPKGAVTGRIRVEHARPSGAGTVTNHSPLLIILGRPDIDSILPAIGPIGTTVAVKARNLGSQLTSLIVTLGGRAVQNLTLRGDTLLFTVPSGAVNGTVEIVTPAGSAHTDFTVTPGLANGAVIQVGGSSSITLAQAAGLAGGWISVSDTNQFHPFDDDDGAKDPPLEPGDFITDLGVNAVPLRYPVGETLRDTIQVQGRLLGDHAVRLVRDSLSVVVENTLTIDGEFASLNLTVDGTVIVRGNNHSLNRPKVRGTLILEGDNMTVVSPEIGDGIGPGLIIRGNGNRVTGAQIVGKGGDGLRIEGGRNNQVEITRSTGNAGDGIVLTGGAEQNQIKFYTGRLAGSGDAIVPLSGNLGHGLLLLGNARSNSFSHYIGGSSGNGGDGIRLDGEGVTGNTFFGHLCTANGGNGITVTNGAHHNSFGTRFATGICRSNQLSGFAIYGSTGTELSSINTGNGTYGLLISGVDDRVGGRPMLVASGLFDGDGTNGRAGLRLEVGTRGVRVDTSIGDLKRNRVGVEIAGTDTRYNSVNVVVRDAIEQGVVVEDAVNNDLTLTVDTVGGHGAVFRSARNNSVRLGGIDRCVGTALVVEGAFENHFFSSRTEPSTSNAKGAENGIVISGGSQRNLFERLIVTSSAGTGVVLRDPGTSRNQFIRSILNGSARDGVRILAGASGNRLGDEGPTGAEPFRLAIQDNAGAGVRVSGVGTDDNEIRLANFARQSRQAIAIIIEGGAAGTLVVSNSFLSAPGPGSGQIETAVLVRDGARAARIRQNRFSQMSARAIQISNALEVVVGGELAAEGNTFSSQPVGVEVVGAEARDNRILFNTFTGHTQAAVRLAMGAHDHEVGPGNTFDQNLSGLVAEGAGGGRIEGNRFTRQSGAGLEFSGGTHDQQVRGNTLLNNAVGIRVSGGTTRGNRIFNNMISANTGRGIELLEGANDGIQPPELTVVSGDSLSGTAQVADGSQVQVFLDAGDEGERWLGDALVIDHQFTLYLPVEPWVDAASFQINATVTDPAGNTSAFSQPFGAATPPLRVVWSSTRDGNAELYLLDPGSSTPRRLTTGPGSDDQPSLSRDGTRLLFVSGRDGNREIYSQEPRVGAAVSRLTQNPAADYDPVWSPDGTRIAFTSDREGSAALFTMKANGSEVARVLPAGVSGQSASWSPDGQWLAYSRTVAGRGQLALVRPDGTDDHLLSPSAANETQPVWSPDGLWLAFASDAEGDAEIYVVRADGTERRRLTFDPAADRDPVWMPDGQRIVFSSERRGEAELYSVPITGGDAVRMTVSGGANGQPTMSRVP